MPPTTAQPSRSDTDCSTIEAARLLGMAVRSVQMMVDRGDLHAWKTPGGHRRISRASVDEWLSRRPGAGVVASAPAAPGAPADRARLREAQPPRAARARAAPLRVLLIEDSRHYQNLVSMLVQQHLPEAELHVADDGIAGLALAGRLEPELLIVDILLPGIDGATLITSLRSHPQFSRSRLVVVTSLDEDQRAPYAFALAGLPVVHKTKLVTALPAMLTRFAAEHAGGAGRPA
jgi:excisionase family DNA binding protein